MNLTNDTIKMMLAIHIKGKTTFIENNVLSDINVLDTEGHYSINLINST
jgi:hypothetical protein